VPSLSFPSFSPPFFPFPLSVRYLTFAGALAIEVGTYLEGGQTHIWHWPSRWEKKDQLPRYSACSLCVVDACSAYRPLALGLSSPPSEYSCGRFPGYRRRVCPRLYDLSLLSTPPSAALSTLSTPSFLLHHPPCAHAPRPPLGEPSRRDAATGDGLCAVRGQRIHHSARPRLRIRAPPSRRGQGRAAKHGEVATQL